MDLIQMLVQIFRDQLTGRISLFDNLYRKIIGKALVLRLLRIKIGHRRTDNLLQTRIHNAMQILVLTRAEESNRDLQFSFLPSKLS